MNPKQQKDTKAETVTLLDGAVVPEAAVKLAVGWIRRDLRFDGPPC